MPHVSAEMAARTVSELCQMPPETPDKHRELRGHGDAHRCEKPRPDRDRGDCDTSSYVPRSLTGFSRIPSRETAGTPAHFYGEGSASVGATERSRALTDGFDGKVVHRAIARPYSGTDATRRWYLLGCPRTRDAPRPESSPLGNAELPLRRRRHPPR
jgi:hypothetical protein